MVWCENFLFENIFEPADFCVESFERMHDADVHWGEFPDFCSFFFELWEEGYRDDKSQERGENENEKERTNPDKWEIIQKISAEERAEKCSDAC